MVTNEELTLVFDKAISSGLETLSERERNLYRIQWFILEWENGSLSGYFYNILPETIEIEITISAMNGEELRDLSMLIREGYELFDDYRDPETQTTWAKVLEKYDPENRLRDIDKRIALLENYGISN